MANASPNPLSLARWTARVEGGPRRVNHAAVAVGDLVFSFGGYCTGDNYKDRRVAIDVFVLHVESLRWHEVPRPPTERQEASGHDHHQDDNDDDDEEGADHEKKLHHLRWPTDEEAGEEPGDYEPKDNWPFQR